MKNLFKKISVFALVAGILLIVSFTGCERESPEDFLGSISVQLVLKEGLGDIPLNNINLSLINTLDNVEKKLLSDDSGKAAFIGLPAGTYNLNVSEPREEGEYILTGSVNNIVVQIQKETPVTMTLDAKVTNTGLLIKEVYYPGANDKNVSLFKDQFIEIFNNSSDVIYADSLYVAHVYPDKWNKTLPKPTGEMLDIQNFTYLEWIYRIPGNGKQYPIEPGKSIVIALNAINFKEGNPQADKAVDNSKADFETYAIPWLEAQGRSGNRFFDYDNPDVPNVVSVYIVPPIDYFHIDTYSPAMVIFRKNTDFSESDLYTFSFVNKSGKPEEHKLMKIPVSSVIDGIEIMMNSSLGHMKKLGKSIDESFTYLKADGGGSLSGMSLRRKIDETATTKFGRVVLQDLNNSFIDFEVIDYPDAKGYNNL